MLEGTTSRPSQRASVLTFFAQDTGTHNLVYANADISKATQNREAIAFSTTGRPSRDRPEDADHGREGHHPGHPRRTRRRASVRHLRMRSASLMRYINNLASKDFKTVALDRPDPDRPRVHEDPPSR